MFTNLLLNAADAPYGGKIQARVAITREWGGLKRNGVRITFADTGSGISVENLPLILQPFFTTKGQAGTGIGLSLVSTTLRKYEGVLASSEYDQSRTQRQRLRHISASSMSSPSRAFDRGCDRSRNSDEPAEGRPHPPLKMRHSFRFTGQQLQHHFESDFSVLAASSLLWPTVRWPESCERGANRLRHCRFPCDRVCLRERHRSGTRHPELCHSSQQCMRCQQSKTAKAAFRPSKALKCGS